MKSLFPSIFSTYRYAPLEMSISSLDMESTLYVFPFWMMFFYFSNHGLNFDLSLCENSIKSIKSILIMLLINQGQHWNENFTP